MTGRDNFIRMMSGCAPERVPFDLPMTEPVAQEMERRLGHREVAALGVDFAYVRPHFSDRSAAWREAYREIGFELPEGGFVSGDGYAGLSANPETLGAAWHLSAMLHPLEGITTLEQLQALPWETADRPEIFHDLADQVAAIHRRGLVSVLGLECTVFENAWYRRGMDQLFLDLAEENPIGIWLLDFYAERSRLTALAGAKAGVDLIRLGDDVGTQRGMMMSVPMWREHLKPRLASVIAAIRSVPFSPLVQYHSDGDISDIVDDLIEIGVDILNPLQPECMDLDATLKRWKGRLGFSGMIGTQTTMPFGTPDDVAAAVDHVRKWAARGARLIVAPTHVLEPDVPWANIDQLVRSARQPIPHLKETKEFLK